MRLSNGLKETSIVRTYLIRWVDISLVTLRGILMVLEFDVCVMNGNCCVLSIDAN